MIWLLFAICGAFFAAVVNVISKKALGSLDFLVALTVQGALAVLTLAALATGFGRWGAVKEAPRWALGMMALSGVVAGLAWACGYRALQLADVNRATPIDRLSLPIAVVLAIVFLKEKPSVLNWIGIGLMVVGAVFVARKAGAGG